MQESQTKTCWKCRGEEVNLFGVLGESKFPSSTEHCVQEPLGSRLEGAAGVAGAGRAAW